MKDLVLGFGRAALREEKIAAWSLDTDYDERSLLPRQVFFQMAGTKDGWHKLRKDIKAELNEAALEKL